MFKKSMLAVLATVSIVSAVPNQAHALMMVAQQSDILKGSGDVILCLVLLPFCLLNDKGQVSQVTEQDLVGNGYTSSEIANIKAGQERVIDYMTSHKLNSATQMEETVEVLRPSLNSDYLEFVGQTIH